ncbi:MAG: DUF1206 domain-containing protein [Ornithinimicrobium sp.]
MSKSAEQTAADIGDHPALETLARAGYAVNGLLHLMIAAIVARIIAGGGGEAEQSGALQAVAQAPFGSVLLWIGVVGYSGLTVWQLLDAAVGYRPGGKAASAFDRVKDAGKAGVYAVLAWTTWRFASGGSTDSGQSTADFTTALMGAPGGRFLVAGVGLAVIAVGGYHGWKGLSRAFMEDLDGNAKGKLGEAVIASGLVGYVAKGVALTMVGVLFGWAAWTADPDDATGLDGAVQAVSGDVFGSVVLALIAAGFAAYGVYSFARARFADL